MHVKCAYCGRYREKEEMAAPGHSNGVSHGQCARCGLIFNNLDGENQNKSDAELMQLFGPKIRRVIDEEVNKIWRNDSKGKETYKDLLVLNWSSRIREKLINPNASSLAAMHLRGDRLVIKELSEEIHRLDPDKKEQNWGKIVTFLNELRDEFRTKENQEVPLSENINAEITKLERKFPPEKIIKMRLGKEMSGTFLHDHR